MAGAPKQQPIAQQAAVYANTAVPTVGSINSQYGRSEGDVHGFTNALIQILQRGGTSDPYAGAVASQTGANNAAIQRLTNLGSPNAPGSAMAGNPYAAGSAAAIGGMGDSALGALNQQRGAAIQYQRQLPGIAASRGELANSALLSDQHQALQQRAQQYQSAYMQSLQQLRDYALQRGQLNLSAKTEADNVAARNASLAETQREFGITNAYRYAALAVSAKSSGTANKLGLTPSELQTQIGSASKLLAGSQPEQARIPIYNNANPPRIIGYNNTTVGGTGNPSAVEAGVPFQTAVNLLIQQGVNPKVAILAASREYSTSKSTNGRSYMTFVQYMASHGNKKFQNILQNLNATNRPGIGR